MGEKAALRVASEKSEDKSPDQKKGRLETRLEL